MERVTYLSLLEFERHLELNLQFNLASKAVLFVTKTFYLALKIFDDLIGAVGEFWS